MSNVDNTNSLNYNFWNCDGLNKVKVESMLPFWISSDLVFIQETKLDPSKESLFVELIGKRGFNCEFNASTPSPTNTTWWNYGTCMFYKNVEVEHIDIAKTFPDIISPTNSERLMMVKVKSSLINEEIIFLNLYFPCNSTKLGRQAERQNWASLMLCRQNLLTSSSFGWVILICRN